MQLMVLAGLVLAILGGTKVFDGDPNTVSNGLTYSRAAVIIFLAVLAAEAGINLYLLSNRRQILLGEIWLAWAGLAVTPFFLVRIIYSIICAFESGHSSVFNYVGTGNSAVIVQGIMFVLMEFIVVSIWIVAGMYTPKVPKELLY
ncbi:hypothetical protein A1O1_07967 [Capronia coronata CBS 617.96]|uniref:DUF7702 domain-containing protein n=1 Tax=Capronia coronata CBS 617.96 TaxID=1182541 RepID=W9XX34_9EURO|nr:uncharacterized protein A1O1_07967 [Capronia coronata CBS 617.96]EXJ81900.1 hypothetical protein A1O1_07967 [Capronia coronata CBS 617.96]